MGAFLMKTISLQIIMDNIYLHNAHTKQRFRRMM